MVEFKREGETLILEVIGLDKLWAFKSRLEIPLAHLVRVWADPEIARGWWKGFRMPGTHIPYVIVAGTFYQDGKRIFWDVHDADRTIVIELHDDRYDQLVIEVADPEQAVQEITEWIGLESRHVTAGNAE